MSSIHALRSLTIMIIPAYPKVIASSHRPVDLVYLDLVLHIDWIVFGKCSNYDVVSCGLNQITGTPL
mgnify:FL=1